jgi:hypothetical protein
MTHNCPKKSKTASSSSMTPAARALPLQDDPTLTSLSSGGRTLRPRCQADPPEGWGRVVSQGGCGHGGGSGARTCRDVEDDTMCCFFSYLGRPFFFSRTCVPALRLRASCPGAKTTQKTHTPPAIEWTRREEYSIALPPPHHWYLGFRQSTFGDFLHCRGYPIDFLQPQTMIPSFLGST